ncbi:MAG: hypothetical protein ACRC92_26390 [Peptostreptococcaceae bacterium]
MRMTIVESNGNMVNYELLEGQYKRGVKVVDGVRRRYVIISCLNAQELDSILDIDLRTSKVILCDNVQFDPSKQEMVDVDMYESNVSTLIGGLKDTENQSMFFNITFDMVPKKESVGE